MSATSTAVADGPNAEVKDAWYYFTHNITAVLDPPQGGWSDQQREFIRSHKYRRGTAPPRGSVVVLLERQFETVVNIRLLKIIVRLNVGLISKYMPVTKRIRPMVPKLLALLLRPELTNPQLRLFAKICLFMPNAEGASAIAEAKTAGVRFPAWFVHNRARASLSDLDITEDEDEQDPDEEITALIEKAKRMSLQKKKEADEEAAAILWSRAQQPTPAPSLPLPPRRRQVPVVAVSATGVYMGGRLGALKEVDEDMKDAKPVSSRVTARRYIGGTVIPMRQQQPQPSSNMDYKHTPANWGTNDNNPMARAGVNMMNRPTAVVTPMPAKNEGYVLGSAPPAANTQNREIVKGKRGTERKVSEAKAKGMPHTMPHVTITRSVEFRHVTASETDWRWMWNVYVSFDVSQAAQAYNIVHNALKIADVPCVLNAGPLMDVLTQPGPGRTLPPGKQLLIQLGDTVVSESKANPFAKAFGAALSTITHQFQQNGIRPDPATQAASYTLPAFTKPINPYLVFSLAILRVVEDDSDAYNNGNPGRIYIGQESIPVSDSKSPRRAHRDKRAPSLIKRSDYNTLPDSHKLSPYMGTAPLDAIVSFMQDYKTGFYRLCTGPKHGRDSSPERASASGSGAGANPYYDLTVNADSKDPDDTGDVIAVSSDATASASGSGESAAAAHAKKQKKPSKYSLQALYGDETESDEDTAAATIRRKPKSRAHLVLQKKLHGAQNPPLPAELQSMIADYVAPGNTVEEITLKQSGLLALPGEVPTPLHTHDLVHKIGSEPLRHSNFDLAYIYKRTQRADGKPGRWISQEAGMDGQGMKFEILGSFPDGLRIASRKQRMILSIKDYLYETDPPNPKVIIKSTKGTPSRNVNYVSPAGWDCTIDVETPHEDPGSLMLKYHAEALAAGKDLNSASFNGVRIVECNALAAAASDDGQLVAVLVDAVEVRWTSPTFGELFGIFRKFDWPHLGDFPSSVKTEVLLLDIYNFVTGKRLSRSNLGACVYLVPPTLWFLPMSHDVMVIQRVPEEKTHFTRLRNRNKAAPRLELLRTLVRSDGSTSLETAVARGPDYYIFAVGNTTEHKATIYKSSYDADANLTAVAHYPMEFITYLHGRLDGGGVVVAVSVVEPTGDTIVRYFRESPTGITLARAQATLTGPKHDRDNDWKEGSASGFASASGSGSGSQLAAKRAKLNASAAANESDEEEVIVISDNDGEDDDGDTEVSDTDDTADVKGSDYKGTPKKTSVDMTATASASASASGSAPTPVFKRGTQQPPATAPMTDVKKLKIQPFMFTLPTSKYPYPTTTKDLSGRFQYIPSLDNDAKDVQMTILTVNIGRISTHAVIRPDEARFLRLAHNYAWFCNKESIFALEASQPLPRHIVHFAKPEDAKFADVAVSRTKTLICFRVSEVALQIRSHNTFRLLSILVIGEAIRGVPLSIQFCADNDNLALIAPTKGIYNIVDLPAQRTAGGELLSREPVYRLPDTALSHIVMLNDSVLITAVGADNAVTLYQWTHVLVDNLGGGQLQVGSAKQHLTTYDYLQKTVYVHIEPSDVATASASKKANRYVASIDIDDLVDGKEDRRTYKEADMETGDFGPGKEPIYALPKALSIALSNASFPNDSVNSFPVLYAAFGAHLRDKAFVVPLPYPKTQSSIGGQSQFFEQSGDELPIMCLMSLFATRGRYTGYRIRRPVNTPSSSMYVVGIHDNVTCMYRPAERKLSFFSVTRSLLAESVALKPYYDIPILLNGNPTFQFSKSNKFVCVRWSAFYYEIYAMDWDAIDNDKTKVKICSVAKMVLDEKYRFADVEARFCFDSDDLTIFLTKKTYVLYRRSNNWEVPPADRVYCLPAGDRYGFMPMTDGVLLTTVDDGESVVYKTIPHVLVTDEKSPHLTPLESKYEHMITPMRDQVTLCLHVKAFDASISQRVHVVILSNMEPIYDNHRKAVLMGLVAESEAAASATAATDELPPMPSVQQMTAKALDLSVNGIADGASSSMTDMAALRSIMKDYIKMRPDLAEPVPMQQFHIPDGNIVSVHGDRIVCERQIKKDSNVALLSAEEFCTGIDFGRTMKRLEKTKLTRHEWIVYELDATKKAKAIFRCRGDVYNRGFNNRDLGAGFFVAGLVGNCALLVGRSCVVYVYDFIQKKLVDTFDTTPGAYTLPWMEVDRLIRPLTRPRWFSTEDLSVKCGVTWSAAMNEFELTFVWRSKAVFRSTITPGCAAQGFFGTGRDWAFLFAGTGDISSDDKPSTNVSVYQLTERSLSEATKRMCKNGRDRIDLYDRDDASVLYRYEPNPENKFFSTLTPQMVLTYDADADGEVETKWPTVRAYHGDFTSPNEKRLPPGDNRDGLMERRLYTYVNPSQTHLYAYEAMRAGHGCDLRISHAPLRMITASKRSAK